MPRRAVPILAVVLAVVLAATAPAAAQSTPGQSEAEQWVWNEIQAGRIADLNVHCGTHQLDSRTNDARWNAPCRAVGADFIETVLTREPWRQAVPFRGVRIVGARLTKSLDLEAARIAAEVWLDRSRFEQAVSLRRAHFDGPLSLEGSTFAGGIGADSLEIGQYLNLRAAKIQGGELNLASATIAGDLDMRGGAAFEAGIDAFGLRVGGSLLLRGADVQGSELNLVSARIERQLDLGHTVFKASIDAEGLEVGRFLNLRSAEVQGDDLNLTSAKIARQLDMSNAIVAARIEAGGLAVGGDVLFGNSRFAKAPRIANARIAGDLDLLRARLPGLDLGGTAIAGTLRLADATSMVEWESGASAQGLVLRGTRVGTVQDGVDPAAPGACGARDSWPDSLALEGFVYGRLGAASGNPALDPHARAPCWYEGWLRRDARFAYQPYRQLAGALRALGDRDRADDVLYAARERERREAWDSGACRNPLADWPWRRTDCLTAAGLGILRATIGYGIGARLFRVLWWVLGLTALGAAFLWLSAAARKNGLVWCFGASLDRLLPAVALNKEFADFFDDPPPRRRLRGWQQAYFAAHALAGVLLAALVIAALAGLTQTG